MGDILIAQDAIKRRLRTFADLVGVLVLGHSFRKEYSNKPRSARWQQCAMATMVCLTDLPCKEAKCAHELTRYPG